jgi:GNAT superfamily N-acetyltransferase
MSDLEYTWNEFAISTDQSRLQIDVIYNFLVTSYWSTNIPRAIVERSIEHSLCFGVYNRSHQIGFARVVTDCATFGYIADVFILEPYRGNGLSKWLMKTILDYPELQGFRRWMLATRDAHGLYQQFGFQTLADPARFLERTNLNIYKP